MHCLNNIYSEIGGKKKLNDRNVIRYKFVVRVRFPRKTSRKKKGADRSRVPRSRRAASDSPFSAVHVKSRDTYKAAFAERIPND